MKILSTRVFASIVALGSAGSAIAGTPTQPPGWGWMAFNGASVPVDSPWAIAGLGAIIAVVAARILINRRK